MNSFKKIITFVEDKIISPKSKDIFHSHWNFLRLSILAIGYWPTQNKHIIFILHLYHTLLVCIILRGQVNNFLNSTV